MTTPVKTQTIGDRVRTIAALHALIAYLEANPDLPAPTSIDACYHVHGGTAGARRDIVAAAANVMGSEVTPVGGNGVVQTRVYFGDVDPASLGIRYTVRTHSDDQAGF